MGRGPTKFRQSDVARALKGALATGLPISRVEIDAEGKIVVFFGAATEAKSAGRVAFERWQAEQEPPQTQQAFGKTFG